MNFKLLIKKINLEKISLSLFVFFTMFFPVNYPILRLIFLLGYTLQIMIRRKFIVSGGAIKYLLILLLFNVISFAIGVVNKTPGAIRCVTVEFIWPILFLFFSQSIKSQSELKSLLKIIVYVYLIVVLFDVVYLIENLIGINILPMVFVKALDCKFGAYGSFYQYTTNHMCTLIYMTPVLIGIYFEKYNRSIVHILVLILELILSFFCMLMSGRVIFILTSIMSVGIVFILKIIMSGKDSVGRKEIVLKLASLFLGCIIVFVIGRLAIGLDVKKVISYIIEKFNTSADAGHVDNGVRILQAEALIEGWLEKPIFGHGLGAYTPKCIRSDTMVWAYEYTYLAVLFQKGIIGTIVYFGFFIVIIIKMIKSVKYEVYSRSIVIPFILGFISILIATAADPYLTTFGCMWMLYIPFSIANYDKSQIMKVEAH